MMWAILGEIEFEVIGSPSGWEHQFSSEFAEHARISGKPLLEAVGGALDEITWDIRLHDKLHDVDRRLRAIRAAAAVQEPLALVMGDGTYLGPWVIVEGAVSALKTTARGRITSAEMQIRLREYTGEFTRPTATIAQLALADQALQPSLITSLEQTPTAAQQLVQSARDAENAIRSAGESIRQALDLPIAAATAQASDVLSTLQQAWQSSTTMQQLGGIVQDATAIAQLGADIVLDVQTLQTLLTPPASATIVNQFSDAVLAAQGALQRFDKARHSLLAMTADVAMRRR